MTRRGVVAKALVLAVAVPVVMVPAAWGFWTAELTTGARGAAQATSVGAGSTPTASTGAGTATLSWTPATTVDGQPVTGYLVRRYDAATLAPQTTGAGCTGVVTATSCTETGIPTGSWRFAVVPVVGTNWQGAESPRTGAVAVDATAPVNNLSLDVASGGAALAGTRLYYRGNAAGSLALVNAVTDANSGAAGSATSALGGTTTGWSHAPSTVSTPSGGPYRSNPVAWAAATTSRPTVTITGRDVAGNTTATVLELVPDAVAPTGSISYLDGLASERSVTVTFSVSDGDGGSGVGPTAGRLQRASAALSGGVCGTFGGYADIGFAGVVSPYLDGNLADRTCYRYRYVVADRVGNTATMTTSATAVVDYAGAVAATPGLLSRWRLGEPAYADISLDTMTAPDDTYLFGHVGEKGAGWSYAGGDGNNEQMYGNRAYRNGPGVSLYRASGVPPSADYSVEADLVARSALPGDAIGVVGRLDNAGTTFYQARWNEDDNSWALERYLAGTASLLDSVAGQPDLVVGATYRLRLEMAGTRIRLYVNGRKLLAVTDAAIAATGSGGIRDGVAGSPTTKGKLTGVQVDRFRMSPAVRATDTTGTNHGTYENYPTLGVSGALQGDTDTAAGLDGVDDYMMVPSPALPTGSAARSVEVWFNTSSSARQALFDYGSPAAGQEFGLWLDAGAGSMTAWGWGVDNDNGFTLPDAVNDGAWHQVVETYDGSMLTLYLDGAPVGSQAATRNTVSGGYPFVLGAILVPDDPDTGGFFAGSLDEVSVYGTALPASTVRSHYLLGTALEDLTGPAGGSVDATGLGGTGLRWSTSKTLTLALTPGADPSGLASSGRRLLRATSTAKLTPSTATTESVCGAFGPFTLIANDPGATLTDTVVDDYCYRYGYEVADVWGNVTTYTSPEIKVDTTAPALSGGGFSALLNAFASGTTVFYRPTVAGQFTATIQATDPHSGISGFTLPVLGSGWSASSGVPGTATYSWAANPAVPPTSGTIVTNHAGSSVTSPPVTFTPDSSKPTAGSITYTGGVAASSSVPISFVTGSDSGSGVGTRQLQRASASYADGACGQYAEFATIATNPATSPFTDTVAPGACYRYQYVVSDNVGNQTTYASAEVVQVPA